MLIRSSELFGLYNVDPAKADARFKSRPVSVSGRVAEVRRATFIVRLRHRPALRRVRATALCRCYETSIPPSARRSR
jgi:hypothetical protein